MTALRKLLVVDDDPVVGASFNRVLSGKGYIVVSAENGHAALEKLRAEKFDAVFTDLRMPGIDGLQVAEKVRAAQPWTPVVIVTGYGSPASEQRARAAGVSDFLRKPLSPEMIEESAEKAVRTVFEGVTAPLAEQPQPVEPVAPPTAEAVIAQPAAPPAAEAAIPQPAAAEAAPRSGVPTLLKNMVLFLAAPFIGLVYAVLLPFVGIGMLAWIAAEGLRKPKAAAVQAPPPSVERAAETAPAAEAPAAAIEKPRAHGVAGAAKVVLGVLAAPFIGLAWILVLPFAGLAALAWMGARAAFVRD